MVNVHGGDNKGGDMSRQRLENGGGGSIGNAGREWAIGLLREAEPYSAPVGRKQRVQLALGYREGRRRRAIFRPAVAIALLIAFGCGAIASAEIGHWRGWASRVMEVWTGRPAMDRPSSASPSAPARAGARVRPTTAMVVDHPATPVRTRTRARSLQSPAGGALPDEAAPVLEALRALRIEKDPVRARALVALYLHQHPSGSLADEALAISIEAAVTHHDPDAASLADRYLVEHPKGPFRTMAAAAKVRADQP
jgi:hypothetical protein